MPFTIDPEGDKLCEESDMKEQMTPKDMRQGSCRLRACVPGCMDLERLWRVDCRRLLTRSYTTKQTESKVSDTGMPTAKNSEWLGNKY